MNCLRERTGEMDFLCVKTVEGRAAEVDYSLLPDVSFFMQMQPAFTSSIKRGLHAPNMRDLVMPCSTSEGAMGELLARALFFVLHHASTMSCRHTLDGSNHAAGREAGEGALQSVHEWLGALACDLPGEPQAGFLNNDSTIFCSF